MKALIVGGGGREHALAWKIKQDDAGAVLLAAPGNPGIAELARCVPIRATDSDALAALAASEAVDLTVVGPEAPLAAGLVDVFEGRGLPVFGPSRAAARIETSKRFAKELMLRAGVPTARATWHTDVASAQRAIRAIGAPVVVKASGLAAGKGVSVCYSVDEADLAVEAMLQHGVFGDAGAEVLVEEYMEGEELSLFAITDGERYLPMLPVQDHKRLNDGDRGPNTGGMGAYAPVSTATQDVVQTACSAIIEPTLSALREHRARFRGLLYVGLMVTSEGPKVVEFNCRFGDPETQALLPLLAGSLLEPLLAVARGEALSGAEPLEFSDQAAVTTVLAAPGYPEAPETGGKIDLPPGPTPRGVLLFHAGTSRTADGQLVTAGGRVLAVTAVAAAVEDASRASVDFARQVSFPGRQFRTDIGWRELTRHARAS